jgi:23S rRNA (adenine2503-C2)-methyltransferase
MLADINDRDWQAERLALLLKDLTAHINLIPFNPWAGAPVEGTDEKGIKRFARLLENLGVEVSVRWSRGQDVGAACGQLALQRPAGPAGDADEGPGGTDG